MRRSLIVSLLATLLGGCIVVPYGPRGYDDGYRTRDYSGYYYRQPGYYGYGYPGYYGYGGFRYRDRGG